jgi:putative transcriptional regulator
MISRRDDLLLIIKVLMNVDSLDADRSRELLLLANFLECSSLVLSQRSGRGELETGVIYMRHRVPILNLQTLADLFLEGVPPLAFAAPGGIFVRLDSAALRKIRQEKGISLGALAKYAGVSRKTIQMYEAGMSPTVDVALKLEEALGEPLVLPFNPFEYRPELSVDPSDLLSMLDLDDTEKEAITRLEEIGYEVVPTVRCPFNALSRDRISLFIMGIGRASPELRSRARHLFNIARVAEKQAFMVLERAREVNIEGTPVIRLSELKRMRNPEEVRELVSEREKA